MTKAERELQAIRHKLTEWEWEAALAIFKILPRRLITYRSLSILATGTDAAEPPRTCAKSLTPPLEAPPHRRLTNDDSTGPGHKPHPPLCQFHRNTKT